LPEPTRGITYTREKRLTLSIRIRSRGDRQWDANTLNKRISGTAAVKTMMNVGPEKYFVLLKSLSKFTQQGGRGGKTSPITTLKCFGEQRVGERA